MASGTGRSAQKEALTNVAVGDAPVSCAYEPGYVVLLKMQLRLAVNMGANGYRS